MKRLLSAMLVLILMLTLVVTVALADEGKKSGAFTYQIKGNGTATIIGYDWDTMKGRDIFIPRMLDGYTVTEIADEAFALIRYDKNEIPTNHFSKEREAGSLVIPDTVKTIGEKAFWGISFATKIITIPQSVEYIGAGAFSNIFGIEKFEVVSGNPVYTTIDGVLYNKREKMLVSFPHNKETTNFTIPDGIKHIEDYAFWNTKITEGTTSFPSTLETIGEFSFGLTFRDRPKGIFKIVFPASLMEMKKGAFYRLGGDITFDLSKTKIKEISAYTFATSVTYAYDNTYKDAARMDVLFPSELKTIGDSAFLNNFIRFKKLPSSVVEIKNGAFRDVRFYSSFAIDSDSELQTIGEYAFSGCSTLESLFLPPKLEGIGSHAFSDSEDLETLTIPSSVKNIGEDFCDRSKVYLNVEAGSYAALYASENGYMVNSAEEDTSWLD